MEKAPETWLWARKAVLVFAAELLSLYPKQQIFILGRDGEFIYDAARLILKSSEGNLNRLHLINVSSKNFDDPHLRNYLRQEGLIISGRGKDSEAVIVDTGFGGSIAQKIIGALSNNEKKYVTAHYLSTTYPGFKSSKAAQQTISKSGILTTVDSLNVALVCLEFLPRYTDRSFAFEEKNGILIPVSLKNASTDGEVNKEVHLQLMQDLISFWERLSVRKEIGQIQTIFDFLKMAIYDAKTPQDFKELESVVKKHIKDPALIKAMITDVAESLVKSGFEQVSPELKEYLGSEDISSNRFRLLKEHPEWSSWLTNSKDGLRELIIKKDWKTLEIALDADVDVDLDLHITHYFFNTEYSDQIPKHLLMKLLNTNRFHIYQYLSLFVFDKPKSFKKLDLLNKLIDKAPISVLQDLFGSVFRNPESVELKSQFKRMLKRGGERMHGRLASLFGHPHTVALRKELMTYLRSFPDDELQFFVEWSLTKDHWKNDEKLIDLILKHSGPETQWSLAYYYLRSNKNKKVERYLKTHGDDHVLMILDSPEDTQFLPPRFGSIKEFAEGMTVTEKFELDLENARDHVPRPFFCEKIFDKIFVVPPSF